MTTYYSIDSANGNQITTGISEHLARRTAQQLADRRNETVTLYSDDDSEEIEPTEIEVEMDSPNGPRVRYGAQDAETVEAEIPAGWKVDWSNAVNLAPTGTHRIRYSAPLVSDGTVEAMIAERDGAMIEACPYEAVGLGPGRYRVSVEIDANDDEACAEILTEIREAIGPGWSVEWTGNGNGNESDIHIEWEG